MKRMICLLMAFAMCAALFGCGQDGRSNTVNQTKTVDDVLNSGMQGGGSSTGNSGGESKPDTVPLDDGNYDVDLTVLNSTMVYSEVYNMVNSPEDYIGKKVKMAGTFAYLEGKTRYYFACFIADATACCSQGIEFVLRDERKFPDEYPAAGDEITVSGIFDVYYEGDQQYCQLVDATMW